MNNKNSKFKTIVMYKDKKTVSNSCKNRRSRLIVRVQIPNYQTPNTLKILTANLSNLYNIILINIKFNRTLPISSTNFKSCTFETIGGKSHLYLNEFGTIEISPSIDTLKEKNFDCFVYSRLSTLSVLLLDPNSPNFIETNKETINSITFTPNKTILNIHCYVTTVPITLSDFKYVSEPINIYSPWEFYGKRITDTAVIVVNDNLNNKIFGSLKSLTSFSKDLYIISTSLTPSSSNISLEFINIKVSGSLFIILPDNYGTTLSYSNLNIIKQL
ncbi:hypothetical protein ABFP60_14425 [Clostridioides difficile]